MKTNGFLYMVRRDGRDIRFLCPAHAEPAFVRNPSPHEVRADVPPAQIQASLHANRMHWEPYFEQGTHEQILRNWVARGRKFASVKHKPVLGAAPGDAGPITRKVSLPFLRGASYAAYAP